jgi:hypothetical protein
MTSQPLLCGRILAVHPDTPIDAEIVEKLLESVRHSSVEKQAKKSNNAGEPPSHNSVARAPDKRVFRDAYRAVLRACRIRRAAHSPLRPPSTAAAAADDDAAAPKATVQFTVAESTDSSAGGINRQRKRGGGTMTLKKVSSVPCRSLLHHFVFPTTQLLSLSPL